MKFAVSGITNNYKKIIKWMYSQIDDVYEISEIEIGEIFFKVRKKEMIRKTAEF